MKTSRLLLATQKQDPSEVESISHKLMLRSGMIRQLAAGIYTWLPFGIRVLRKVEAIIREEMDRAGAQELLLPAVQPAEIWQESGRWEDYGPELLRFRDRHQREFCLGPTHEEVISLIARDELQSYRDLPVNFYQIQTKFRDEIRPRFGVMRGREFIMKDAYSFDLDTEGMVASYNKMRLAYEAIFARLGLETVIVDADSGAIGGSRSEEFHLLADTGEDSIALCQNCGYSSNVELTDITNRSGSKDQFVQDQDEIPPMEQFPTPGIETMQQLADFTGTGVEEGVKTMIIAGVQSLLAVVIRGDHSLNLVKLEKHPLVQQPLRFATASEIVKACGASPGSVGPVGLNLPILVDHDAAAMRHFSCGANQPEQHYHHVQWGRDLPVVQSIDLRKASAGDPCPQCEGGRLSIREGIEVGHIFQLGQKYSQAMNVVALDSEGNKQHLFMGCYGIGVTRIVAASIEQNHDQHGIIWPYSIAPYQVCIVPIQFHKNDMVQQASKELYTNLHKAGYQVLLDDRNERPGSMFAEMDLLGIPHRLVVSAKNLPQNQIEYRNRATHKTTLIESSRLMAFLSEQIQPDLLPD